MPTNITDYVSVHRRAADFGCEVPQGICLLPANFESATGQADFHQLSEAATVRTLFRTHNIPLGELLPISERPLYIQNNSLEWLAPTLFISSGLMSQNPDATAVALHVLASYITDIFKGKPPEAMTVKLDIVVEKQGDWSCKKIRYEGDVTGLSTLPDVVRQVSNE